MAGKGKQNEASEDQEEILEEEQAEELEEGEEEDADRGDDPDPDVNPESLKKVAGGEEESEEAEPEEDEDEGGKKGPPKTVPYARVAELTRKVKELEAQVAGKADKQAEEEEEQPPPYDFKAKNKEKLKLLSEGDLDGAAELEEEIRQQTEAKAKAEAKVEAVQEMTRNEQQRDFDKAVAETLKQHPWLDNHGEEADPEAIEQVVAMRNFYITNKGMPPGDALRKAVEGVAKGRKGSEEEEDAEEKEDKAKAAGAARSKAAIAKGAKAAEKQPPAIAKGKGNRATDEAQLNVEEMDEETFDKLPDAEKKRLRGD